MFGRNPDVLETAGLLLVRYEEKPVTVSGREEYDVPVDLLRTAVPVSEEVEEDPTGTAGGGCGT